MSIGLIYQYVGDKEDLLFMALQEVLDTYMRQIPQALEGITDPLQRFCTAVRAYCRVNGASVEATVLAYRETKSLRKARRAAIMQKELDTNELIAACVRDCIDAGLFEAVDVDMFVYQIVMFCHAWALKSWHFAKVMDVDTYVRTRPEADAAWRADRAGQGANATSGRRARRARHPGRAAKTATGGVPLRRTAPTAILQDH